MARAFMRPFLLTTQFIRLVFVSSALLLPSSATSADTKQPEVFQPVLTGFRCDGFSEVTPDGVLIVEADTLVKLTLFGEYFTTETIVGFTTEFMPSADVVDQMITNNQANTSAPTQDTSLAATTETALSSDQQAASSRISRSVSFEGESDRWAPLADASVRSVKHAAPAPQLFSSPNQVRTELDIKQRKHKRRLLDRRGYDCTDYDRVISYKLAEENIITPNVAVLNIRLPELTMFSGSGLYYYFCLKQPPVPSEALLRDELAAANKATSNETQLNQDEPTTTTTTTTTTASTTTAMSATAPNGPEALFLLQTNSSEHVWVHQGHEWWVMIRVEPPILSIANDCILIVLLLLLSAVTSGLNLGLMSLDMNELAVISSCGDQQERSYARAIAPLRKRGNYLLCSLLLGNVMVNSTLTVILEEMTSGVVAVIGSTLAIVVLGEIVPQAFCARQGLAIGAKTIYLTYAFMILTFPLSYPISCLLDCVLGAEKGHVYDRERLMEFIRITGNHTQLEADEVAIISGALKLKKIKVDQIMTKLEDVFMLPIDCMLDRKTIRSIIEKGYSRIPIYEADDRKQIVALILAKDLALLDPDDQMPLANMLMYCKHPLIFIEDTATLDVALNEFKTGKSHMAIVRQIYDDGEVDKYYEAIGVVTLEDVIEEVLQQEINDETDTLSDNRRKRRRADAQVAHLVDELITGSPTKASIMPAPPTSPTTINLDMMNPLNSKTSTNQSSNNF